MPDFCLPDLGEGLTEAHIVSWMVATGDRVTQDQAVVEVETAKAIVEVPVPYAGIIARLHGDPGDTVAVGAPLVSVMSSDSPDPADSAGPSSAGSSQPASGQVLVGYGTSEAPARRRRTAFSAARRPEMPPVISPVVRKLARDNGLDLRDLHGSGPGGLVRRSDVETALRKEDVGSTKRSAGGPQDDRDEERRPLSAVRKLVGAKMSRSRREIPEATTWVDVDFTEVVAARGATGVSLLGFVARFVVAALRKYPELNGRLDGDDLLIPRHVHLGFAAQTPAGLVVPVIRHAQQLSARDLTGRLQELTTLARDGKATPTDLTGGTFTVNNYGVFGVDGSAPIINPGEVAMLGIGRILDRPWVVDGAVVPRKIAQLSLVFDHRVCDGGTAGGFLRMVSDLIETPSKALAEL